MAEENLQHRIDVEQRRIRDINEKLDIDVQKFADDFLQEIDKFQNEIKDDDEGLEDLFNFLKSIDEKNIENIRISGVFRLAEFRNKFFRDKNKNASWARKLTFPNYEKRISVGYNKEFTKESTHKGEAKYIAGSGTLNSYADHSSVVIEATFDVLNDSFANGNYYFNVISYDSNKAQISVMINGQSFTLEMTGDYWKKFFQYYDKKNGQLVIPPSQNQDLINFFHDALSKYPVLPVSMPWMSADATQYKTLELFKDINTERISLITVTALNSLSNYQNKDQYIAYLKNEIKLLSEGEKIIFLQTIAAVFKANYSDKDIGNSSLAEIPLEDFLESAKKLIDTSEITPVGICRQINQKVAEIGDIIGLKTFVKSVDKHVIAGLQSQTDNKIYFLDYQTLIPTDVSDIERANSYYEKYAGNLLVFGGAIADPKGDVQMRVDSKASKTIQDALRIKETSERTETNLEEGRIIKEKYIQIVLNNKEQQIGFENSYLSLAYLHFNTMDDPYNSLAELNGLRTRLSIGGSHHMLSSNINFIAKDLKTLGTGKMFSADLISGLDYQYARKINLSNNLDLNISSALEAGVLYNIYEGQNERGKPSQVNRGLLDEVLEESHGARLIYYDPTKNVDQCYIETRQEVEVLNENIQEGLPANIHHRVTHLSAGIKLHVVPANIKLNLEGGVGIADFGNSYDVKGQLSRKGTDVSLKYKRENSDLFYYPDNQEFEANISQQLPKSIRDFKGSLTIFAKGKDYDLSHPDGIKTKEYNAGVALNVLFY